MRRLLYIALILLFVMPLALPTTVSAAPPARKIVVFDQEIVNGPAQDALIKAVGGTILKNLPLITGKAVLLPPQAEAALRGIVGVRIDPDIVVEIHKGPPPDKGKKPKEPQPPEELPWGVDRIDAELAWPVSTGSDIKVAIVDTGIDLSHPDLVVAGGYNAIRPRKKASDDNGHGTHCAGISAAVDNEIGVVGVAPQAALFAVKVLDRNGSGYVSDVIDGLGWCIDNQMQVVSMSFGASIDIPSMYDAIIEVHNAGIILVASAGNAYGGPVSYPAAYPEVIAVSATDNTDTIAGFNSVGPQVELAAPGVDILSTDKGASYTLKSGTSMACPHVSGSAALVIATGVTGVENVRMQLQATADDLGISGPDNYYGHGLVDAEEAATGVQTAPRRPGIGQLTTTWAKVKNH